MLNSNLKKNLLGRKRERSRWILRERMMRGKMRGMSRRDN
jgi:hypothetical protein